jgi:uncharacterized protein YndB with AHSA1/START domain
MEPTTDRIEKRIVLHAPQERVWQAISNAEEFGSWFGMELDGPFAPGAHVTGRIRPTRADAAIAKMQEKYAGMPVDLWVERVEPMRVLSFRWHPYAVGNEDYRQEPTTLVTFTLAPDQSGTALTIEESGFDAIPLARRAAAFEANAGGWSMIVQLIEKHLLQAAS